MRNKRHPAFVKFRAAVRKRGLIRPGETVLAAVSGGPDSMALLLLLLELAESVPFTVAVAHFNHRLRPSADADERFVGAAAKRLGLPFYAGRGDVRAFAKARGLGLEEAGRDLRYDFLEKTAAGRGAAKIATGHTMSDQAETVLARILRGTGPAGLSGIVPLRDGTIIRPMLDLDRPAVLDYLRSRKAAFRIDETNTDVRMFRNRIRRRLIPYLEKNFQPAVVRSLARLAAIAAEEDSTLGRLAAAEAKKALAHRPRGATLDAGRLSKLPVALARRVARAFLRELKGDLRGIDFDDVESVLAMRDGAELPISKDLVLERRRGRIGRKAPAREAKAFARLGDGSGRLPVPEAGLIFRGSIKGRKASRVRPAGPSAKTRVGNPLASDDSRGCRLDADRISFPLLVRVRRPGDRYRPIGAPGRKKLKEIFRAKGVPEEERERRPIFLSAGEIVWVLGLPAAENFKVTAATRRILEIARVGRTPKTRPPAGRPAAPSKGDAE